MHRLVALLLLRRRQIRVPLVDWWVEEGGRRTRKKADIIKRTISWPRIQLISVTIDSAGD
jgi:hypothetical protein